MSSRSSCWVAGLLMFAWTWSAQAEIDSTARLRAVPFTQVTVKDPFFTPRLETNRTATLEHNLKWCEETGRIANFAKAAGLQEGEYQGRFYNDSDVYKVLEGAAYILAKHPDPALEKRIDGIIDKIAAAQQPDGYINTYYTLVEPDKRWTDLKRMHELYCAGHMFEAAVAYYKATGKTKFLEVARGMADHIDRTFGPDKRLGYPGHEEIELALVKLYEATGEKRYFDLAQYFIDVRGEQHDPKDKPEYFQIHKPVREQTEAVGHAVRCMYLAAGTTDVATLTGDQAYIDQLGKLWQDVVHRKMAITGGVGAKHYDEAFSEPYELPNDSAYNETCAGIGLALWNQRMLLLHGQARFADVIERVLYNHVPGAINLKGDLIFYINPLTSQGDHHRQSWFNTACCPTNLVRFFPQIPGLIYAQTDNAIYVNLYAANEAEIELKNGQVKIDQQSNFPWDSQARLTVSPEKAGDFIINLRQPSWSSRMLVQVNGQTIQPESRDGYLVLKRKWQPGDVIGIDFDMHVQRMAAHPRVDANRGKIALQRGPVVYCLEEADNNDQVFHLSLPREAKLKTEYKADLLGGVVVIRGEGLSDADADWDHTLYQPAGTKKPMPFIAVPYCMWDNRAPGTMTVWIPEQDCK